MNGGRHSDLVPGSLEKGPRAVLGDQAPQLWSGRPQVGRPLGGGFRGVRASALSSLHPHLQQATQVPEGACSAAGIVPPGVVRHPCLDLGNACWAASLPSLSCLSAIAQ